MTLERLLDKPWLRYYPPGIGESLDYPSISLHSLLRESARRFPERVAIIYYDGGLEQEISVTRYEELDRQSDSLGYTLVDLGINKGDRVAYFMENSPELIIAFYGILKAGAVPVPCNPGYLVQEMVDRLTDSGARAIVCDDELYPVAQQTNIVTSVEHVISTGGVEGTLSLQHIIDGNGPSSILPEIDPGQDLALLPYTGGTTGVSKAAMLTHRNLVVNSIQFARWYQYQKGGETFISALPLSHIGGISGTMIVPISVGGTLVLFRRFNPRGVLRAIQEYRVSRFLGVPAMYIAVLNQEDAASYDLSSLSHSRTNAAPLPAAIKEAFDELVGHEVLVEGYGLTETSPLILANPVHRAKKGSIGIPLPDVEARLLNPENGRQEVAVGEVGELVLRGPQVMRGYWNMPQETTKAIRDGWCYTGDLAHMDDDGYFYIVDRIKDMINVSGLKVWPREVEEVLYSHPQVKQVAVFGAPDPYKGERVHAVVVLKDGQAFGSEEQIRRDLMAFCLQRLASYKVPAVVDLRDSVPMSGAGKVLRRVLRGQ